MKVQCYNLLDFSFYNYIKRKRYQKINFVIEKMKVDCCIGKPIVPSCRASS